MLVSLVLRLSVKASVGSSAVIFWALTLTWGFKVNASPLLSVTRLDTGPGANWSMGWMGRVGGGGGTAVGWGREGLSSGRRTGGRRGTRWRTGAHRRRRCPPPWTSWRRADGCPGGGRPSRTWSTGTCWGRDGGRRTGRDVRIGKRDGKTGGYCCITILKRRFLNSSWKMLRTPTGAWQISGRINWNSINV